MYRRSLTRSLIAAGWLCALSCSLVVDTSDIDQGCGSNRKLCGDQCVELSDPAYGCTRDECAPCRLTNAIPRCDGETCVVAACLFGFDCPEEKTGCLTNVLVDSEHCGHCDTACTDGTSCSNGKCVLGQAGSSD
ncbi:MAG TPA: hypothetical protein VHM25_22235 [Polyangiaceae bacterium]|jgi:hypothetical protein|nr:hypothetical protein [Polyangiaceae bacterium]